MELESIKNSKFEAFKEDVLKNPLKVVGGRLDNTQYEMRQGGVVIHQGHDRWRTGNEGEYLDPSSQYRYSQTWGERGETIFVDGAEPIPGDYEMQSDHFDMADRFTIG